MGLADMMLTRIDLRRRAANMCDTIRHPVSVASGKQSVLSAHAMTTWKLAIAVNNTKSLQLVRIVGDG